MKVLVTGDQGYIGSVLVKMLQEKGYEVFGLDVGYFAENKLESCLENYPRVSKDVRDVVLEDLENIDAIIHLAGLSNDPLGEFNPSLTHEINTHASIRLAELAKKAGVKRFIFSSSQSMYGISELDSELDEDNSEKNPVTAYASAKWDAEQVLNSMSCREFIVTSFRPSTVFGASPRLRCDIVFNNLVASAYTTGRIEIMSDGTPWRPVVHIKDVSNAFISGLEAPEDIISGRSFNVGIKDGNYSVRDLAEAASRSVPNSELVFTGEHQDSRTYKVSFERILTDLEGYYKPEWDLDRGGSELVEMFKRINFTERQFRGKETIRLKQLINLTESNKIDTNFRY
jgi:nucleoside-diphosphate-sugar epimerase